MIPDAIRNAPIVAPLNAREMLAITEEPFQCPTCKTMHSFFVLAKATVVSSWEYRCTVCAGEDKNGTKCLN